MITRKLMESRVKWWKILLIPVYPLIALWFFIKYLLTPPHMRNGIKCVTGDTGGGKSLLAHIISQAKKDKIKIVSNSKFNNDMEIIDIFDHFNEFEIKKDLSNCIVIFDEIQKDFNKRMNRANDYNAVFIPLIEWLTTRRHRNVPMVIFLTQSWDMLDVQLQRIIENVIFVTGKPRQVFSAWVRTSKIRPLVAPKAIQYYARRRKDLLDSDIEKYVSRKKIKYRKIRKYKVPVTIEHLLTFDTFAFKPTLIKAMQEAKGKGGKQNV